MLTREPLGCPFISVRCEVILCVLFGFLNVDKSQVYVNRNAVIRSLLEQHLGRETHVKKSAVGEREKSILQHEYS